MRYIFLLLTIVLVITHTSSSVFADELYVETSSGKKFRFFSETTRPNQNLPRFSVQYTDSTVELYQVIDGVQSKLFTIYQTNNNQPIFPPNSYERLLPGNYFSTNFTTTDRVIAAPIGSTIATAIDGAGIFDSSNCPKPNSDSISIQQGSHDANVLSVTFVRYCLGKPLYRGYFTQNFFAAEFPIEKNLDFIDSQFPNVAIMSYLQDDLTLATAKNVELASKEALLNKRISQIRTLITSSNLYAQKALRECKTIKCKSYIKSVINFNNLALQQ